ncbi:ABC transporter permease [Pontibacillus yanchengensis]|uniref:ABC transporter permease n=1 Tax=Pontibacillus yanchengensis Y32 TaxID=1385514 RepID=A0A0A2TCG3_9BACI|nr:ABC transporter permease subunit [Pontibacillus yanchengensis]KGP71756.1 ABC transporter permease [Pontibacillus yanchengensis Y32]
MRLSETNKAWLLLLPAFLFLLLPLYGLLSALWSSLTVNGAFSLSVYQQLMERDAFWGSLFYSLRIAIIATLLSLGFGLVFTRTFTHYLNKTSGKLAAWIPMLFPHFVWGYLVLLLFQQSGFISYMAFQIGIIESREAFPILTNDKNGFGMIITYMGKEIPFVILMLLPIYAQQNSQYHDLVRTLGGNRWHRFKDAEWPWVYPVLLETGVILFSFIFSAYEIPYLLGATFPEMISILTYDWFYAGDWSERPLAFAAMIFTSVIIGIIAWIGFSLMNRKRWLLTKGSR